MPRWMRRSAIGLGVVTAICLLPVAAVLLSLGLARLGHCTLNEAAVHPCVIAGRDIGSFLAALFVLGWLMLITGPILNLALTAWIMLGVIALAGRLAPPGRRRVIIWLTVLTVICLEPAIALVPGLALAAITGIGAQTAPWMAHAYAQRLRAEGPLVLIPVLAWIGFGIMCLIRPPRASS